MLGQESSSVPIWPKGSIGDASLREKCLDPGRIGAAKGPDNRRSPHLIKKQHRRYLQDRLRDRDPLALAAKERDPRSPESHGCWAARG
jgi:hypothetical protein